MDTNRLPSRQRWLPAFILIAMAFPAWPQVRSGIKGTVVIAADKTTTVVAGIEVSLQCQKMPNRVISRTTDETGSFTFSDLPSDQCLLTISDPRFEEHRESIGIVEGQVVERTIQLGIRQLQQNVVVTAEPPRQLDTTSSSTAAPPVTQNELQSAPLLNGRFQDALPLLPGVVRGPDGLIDIKGGRPDQSSTLINSVSAADPATGNEAISLPLEAVESVTVRATPFTAEYGSFSTGVTEVETRSGTEKWKYLLTNFLPRPRRRAGSFMGVGSFTPRFTLAGPLQKDKLFLFQSFDYRFSRTSVPSLPALKHDQSFETFDSSTQLDWNASSTNHFSSNFLSYPENVRYPLLNTFLPQQSNPDFRRRGYLVSFNDRASSMNTVLESSFSIKRYDAHIFPASGRSDEFVYYPEQNFGSWFNRQDRNTWMEQWSETYRIGEIKWHGDHAIAIGSSYIHQSSEGTVTNQRVTVERENHTRSSVIDYGNPAHLNADSNLLSLFAQDHWMPFSRLSLDFGARFDHDSVSDDAIHVAPRIGFVIAPTKDNKTVVRGGIGFFYDKIPLDIATFMRYPAETVTQFAADGLTPSGKPVLYAHQVVRPAFRQPYSVAWDVQLDRELTHSLMVRLGYHQHHTQHDFFLQPVNSAGSAAVLQLWNTGRESYRDYEATLRWQATSRTRLFASYVHSKAEGDLNSFQQYLGDFPNPIIRANQYGRLRYDAPNRFLLWGSLGLPWKFEFWPVLDVHTGFPYSRVDSDLNFVGRRNTERFPTFVSFDFQVVRTVRLSLLGRKRDVRLGLKVFDATGHFNPRDVQDNIASPNYGKFYNAVGTRYAGKFEFDF